MDKQQYLTLTNIFFNPEAKKYRAGLLELKKIYDDDLVPPPSSDRYNPIQIISLLDKKQEIYGTSYSILRNISTYDPLIASIINTRISQVLNFAKPAPLATNPYCYDFLPLIEKPNPELKEKLFKFISKMGIAIDPGRDNFANFLKKIVRDRLRYDQVNFEIVYNKDNLPVAVYVVDPETIRKVPESSEDYQKYRYYTYQVIQGEIRHKFYFHEMAWGVYYARSDLNAMGYGMSEIEMALHILASKIYAEEYNKYYFLQGGSKGLLFIKKTVLGRTQMSGFQEEWQTAISGYSGAHRIPVLSSPAIDDIRYISIDRTNKEMEFARWLDYCVNVLCAVFCISPQEVNFPPRGIAGGGGILQSEGMYQQQIKHSRDKGLRPLLQFIEELINTYIIFPLTGETYAFVFKGLDDLSPREKLDNIQRSVQTYKTINEIRKEEGLDPLPVVGDIILNPIFMQNKMSSGMIGLTPPASTPPPSAEEEKPVEESKSPEITKEREEIE